MVQYLTKSLFPATVIVLLAAATSCSKIGKLKDIGAEQEIPKDSVEYTIAFSDEAYRETDETYKETKGLPEVNFNSIKDINYYIFNQNGDLAISGFKTVSNAQDLVLKAKFVRQTGYCIYVIANKGINMGKYTQDELFNLKYSVPNYQSIFTDDGNCIMTGSYSFVAAGNESVEIPLRRIVAKITVKCNYSNLNSGIELSVKKVMVKSIPSFIYYFRESFVEGSGNVIDSNVASNSELDELCSNGVTFYMLENYQEYSLKGALDNKQKSQLIPERLLDICGYVYLEYEFKDNQKAGPISYRFYIGKTMQDLVVERNNHYVVTINFNGNASRDELSVSVDNSGLKDRVQYLEVLPGDITFSQLGENLQLRANIFPETAYDKRVSWSSSNPEVASISPTGILTSVSNGNCEITAVSTENAEICGFANVTVKQSGTAAQESISFAKSSYLMLDIDEITIKYSMSGSPGCEPVFSCSDNSVAKITGYDSQGIKVKGLKSGACNIVAKLGTAEASCVVSVDELKLVADSQIVLYKDFYGSVGYKILPEWAKDRKLFWKRSDSLPSAVFNFVNTTPDNKLCGAAATASGQFGELTVGFEDCPQKCAKVKVVVNPTITMRKEITCVVNNGYDDIIEGLQLQSPQNSLVKFSFEGRQPNGAIIPHSSGADTPNGYVRFANPCQANGKYCLVAEITGDNGNTSKAKCNISIYEQVYIVGISKSMDIDKGSRYIEDGVTYISVSYENEIVAKYLAHPLSILFPAGVISHLPFSYVYNGVRYTTDYPGITEVAGPFTFSSANPYELAFGKGTGKSLYPPKYIQYFALESDTNGYMIVTEDNMGHVLDEPEYIFVSSRVFGGGFCNETTSWKEIFEYVYGN